MRKANNKPVAFILFLVAVLIALPVFSGPPEYFLLPLKPEAAVISCGKDNSFGHPKREVLDRLDAFDCDFYRTDRLNINVANADQLTELPRIGPVKAQAIVDYRIEHGAFERIEDFGKALEWYRKSAGQGNAVSQYSLGLMYANGQGNELSRPGFNETGIPFQMRLTPHSLKAFVNLFNSRSNSIKHLMWP